MRGIGRPAITGPITQRATPPMFLLSGVTLDSTGAILGGCNVEIFRYGLPGGGPSSSVGWTVSDSASGAWSFEVSGDPTATYFCVQYKSGAPDVYATTLNTLVGTVT